MNNESLLIANELRKLNQKLDQLSQSIKKDEK